MWVPLYLNFSVRARFTNHTFAKREIQREGMRQALEQMSKFRCQVLSQSIRASDPSKTQ